MDKIRSSDMRAQSPGMLIIIAIAAILISACSSAPPVQPIEKVPEVELNPADAVNTIENEITAASENQI
jgi:predicted component of type VI protein secretion system